MTPSTGEAKKQKKNQTLSDTRTAMDTMQSVGNQLQSARIYEQRLRKALKDRRDEVLRARIDNGKSKQGRSKERLASRKSRQRLQASRVKKIQVTIGPPVWYVFDF
jgi:hypothetical protein